MSVNILAMVQPIQSNIKQSAPLDHNNISDGTTNQTMIENSKVPDVGDFFILYMIATKYHFSLQSEWLFVCVCV